MYNTLYQSNMKGENDGFYYFEGFISYSIRCCSRHWTSLIEIESFGLWPNQVVALSTRHCPPPPPLLFRTANIVCINRGLSLKFAAQGAKNRSYMKYMCFEHYCSCPSFVYTVLKPDPHEAALMVVAPYSHPLID